MNVIAIFAILALATAASASSIPEPLERRQLEYLFESWRIEYGVSFDTAVEYVKRMDIFASNHWEIAKHNTMNYSYTLAHNEFSHMTHDEFKSQMLGFGKVPVTNYGLRTNAFADVDAATLATSVDWTTKGAVTPVKNQGQCGSCWSFSTTGALEGAYFIKNGKLNSFAEQNLVDCDKVDQGCNGGLMDNAFDFVKKNGGICLESDYTYTAADGQCKTSCTKVPMTPTHTDVAQSEHALQAAVTQQPVAIAIEADQFGFQFYSTGVFTGSCGSNLDHGVLLVGFGEQDGTKFWKVKNSWGPSWGAKGYILIEKGKAQNGGQCGLLLSASYPNL